jgi:TRAP-type C4-dicarboxylate transport system substrate-binding protein
MPRAQAVVIAVSVCKIEGKEAAGPAINGGPRGRKNGMTTRTAGFALAACMFAGAGIPLAGSANAQTVDGPTIEWKHSLWGKRRANTEGIEKVNEIIKARTGGKFSIKIGYGEVFSKGTENLDALKIGAIQSADICNFFHPGKTPAWMVFSLPFLPFTDLRVTRDVGEVVMRHPALVKDLEQWDSQHYFMVVLPQSEFMGKGKPPKTLDDWKGLRLRAGGGLGDAMRLLGAVPSTVPATDVYTAMERGTIDGAAFPHSYAHAAYQIHTVASWFTNNMNPSISGCGIAVNRKAWAALPPQYQKLLDEAKPAAYEAMIQAYGKADDVNIPMFRKRLTEVLYTDEQLKDFREKGGRPIWEKWVADNQSKFDAKSVLDLTLAEAEKAIAKYAKK